MNRCVLSLLLLARRRGRRDRAVVNRKVWGGNRTRIGSRAQQVLMSVFETFRRHARSAPDFVNPTVRSFGNRALQRPALT